MTNFCLHSIIESKVLQNNLKSLQIMKCYKITKVGMALLSLNIAKFKNLEILRLDQILRKNDNGKDEIPKDMKKKFEN